MSTVSGTTVLRWQHQDGTGQLEKYNHRYSKAAQRRYRRCQEKLSGEAYGDDSSVFYRIRRRSKAVQKAFYLKKLAHIVLDIGEKE